MKKISKKQLIIDLKTSINKNLLAENLTFLQRPDFINAALNSPELFITNKRLLKILKTTEPHDGITFLLSLSPSVKFLSEALSLIELLDKILENHHFVSDSGKLLTYLFNNLEV